MTLLTKGITFYYLCLLGGHRFQRAKPDHPYCPRCGGEVRLYGLKDDTRYAEQDQEVESVPGEELPGPGS